MERIKAALERARKERETLSGPLSRGGGANTPPAVEIAFTHTAVLPVSASHLHDHHVLAPTDVGDGAYSDPYKILRTQVLSRLREHNWNTLAITSAGPDEGKTLTAINLAVSLALEVNCTVLLVDSDLRRPSVHKYFGIEPRAGLSDYLAGRADIPDLLVNPEGYPRLVILPAGKHIANSAEMLSSPRMTALVRELKNRYPSRLVLFDLPPVLAAADALSLIPQIDGTLLVVEDRKTQSDDLLRMLELLQHCEIIGTVLNKADVRMGYY